MENAFHFPLREGDGTAMTQADTCSTCSSELCDLGCAVGLLRVSVSSPVKLRTRLYEIKCNNVC